ncbi:MAG: SMEK domain-containing protein [Marinifilaceae bacterium]|nr:SMEK domain-containing protein [Marinifilaceae bacterium]
MNRSIYFNYIEERLVTLGFRIERRGKLNVLDLHLHSENFYQFFFNLLYGYKLVNANYGQQNVESIDLIDKENKVVIQVSATCTKQKIESSLSKESLQGYNGYSFKFISISKEASSLRMRTYKNPHSIVFIPGDDIFDIDSILKDILNKPIEEQKSIYKFIKEELGHEVSPLKVDSNLASVINILSQEAWDEVNKPDAVNVFEIDRKISYNNLTASEAIIKEYFVYYSKVDEKYSEFDLQGKNKSFSVLSAIRKEYLKNKNIDNADKLFETVVDSIREKVLTSANFTQIPIDELDLCVDILVVDAFIRCKIFENPEKYRYATSR